MATIQPMSLIKQLVVESKRNRKNRVFYPDCFSLKNAYLTGLLQTPDRSSYDLVQLNPSKNEYIKLYGFDQAGSSFEFSLSLLTIQQPSVDNCSPSDFSSSNQSAQKKTNQNFNWRLGSVRLVYFNSIDNAKYSYSTDELIDYRDKSDTLGPKHEARSLYKVGEVSFEITLPFSLSRILFNGLFTRRRSDGVEDIVSGKLTISTHPTGDKFDYTYNFSSQYLSKSILKCVTGGNNNTSVSPANGVQSTEQHQFPINGTSPVQSPNNPTLTMSTSGVQSESSARGAGLQREQIAKLIRLALEDRVDQTMMFQGCMELHSVEKERDNLEDKKIDRFVMWGGKVKKFLDVPNKGSPELYESLYVWVNSGLVVHLTRPIGEPNLVYGLVFSAFDYSSSLYDAKIFKREGQIEVSFDQLESLADVPASMRIELLGYKVKEIVIDFEDQRSQGGFGKPQAVTVNGFKGWACGEKGTEWFGSQLAKSRTYLWTMPIDPVHAQTHLLASEKLLGGKGNSLIQLNQLVYQRAFNGSSADQTDLKVSVPPGVVVTSAAYNFWLASNPLIMSSIDELDRTRRALAARSFYVNPFSHKHLTMTQHQQILKDQCDKTCLLLKSCPLPAILRKHLYQQLVSSFDEQALQEPVISDEEVEGEKEEEEEANHSKHEGGSGNKISFAVRSSAVGEDSLETSAAGQMTTILGLKGFQAICKAIVDCWASQFQQEAVTYKSQNGLPLNLDMAVVVQQLVWCDLAGVGATCDPLTGNQFQLELLANRGLGEGVVAGKKTDTVRVCLKELAWDTDIGCPRELFRIDVDEGAEKAITRMQAECCLSSSQILALANILIRLRQLSTIKDREVEWGITSTEQGGFQVHLLQSRPLTNLARLSSREVDHELDFGFSSPLDLCSRANLGEVMPGALCPLTATHFLLASRTSHTGKPFHKNHTSKTYASDSFGFHAQVVAMVLSHNDTLTRIQKLKQKDKEEAEQVFRTMLGTVQIAESERDQIDKLNKEHINPLCKSKSRSVGLILALDIGLAAIYQANCRLKVRSLQLTQDLTSIDELIERTERPRALDSEQPVLDVGADLQKLWSRLVADADSLKSAWLAHINGTILSMSFNSACMKLLVDQPAYSNLNLSSTEILNDFSVLMRGGGRTESAQVAELLDRLVECLVDEGRLEASRRMSIQELWSWLSSDTNVSRCALKFRKFMARNGHRAYKEFDYSTLTWADNPRYIVMSLALRLKSGPASATERRRAEAVESSRCEADVSNILSKVTRRRTLLTGYLLPRARLAVVRRESSKSLLILAIDKYRQAFRHLGALLCLAGRIPSAELVFFLAFEELESLMDVQPGNSLISRLIYKARRRQQRQRVLNQITWPRPLLQFGDVIDTTRQKLDPQLESTKDLPADTPGVGAMVRGYTSCSGRVTGRALVVSSIDQMEQIQPNDILITYSIDISWSVYFFTLAGIVTEVGGIVSHGAVVAREYGIPTLCTALDACSKFKTGQLVTLDASRGVCYLANSEEQVASTGVQQGPEVEQSNQA